jgi:hypothetical protein
VRLRSLTYLGFLALSVRAFAADKPWIETLKPQVNPALAALPDNTWKLMRPKGSAFEHPKTEVGLVYDEGLGSVIYFAGCSNGYCNNVWVYQVGTDNWNEVMPWVKGREEDTGKPIGQCGYAAVFNNDLGLYFKHRACSSTADGRGGRGRDSNSWTLDARNLKWERVATGLHEGAAPDWPGAFCCYGLVYDRDAKVALMYGGLDGDRELWQFDFRVKKWANRKAKQGPPALFLHSMVYDSVNKVTLLFGGQAGNYSEGHTQNETWAYDYMKNAWEKRTPAKSPPARAQAQACFDSVNGVMLVFGGHANVYPKRWEGEKFADTWAYDYKAGTWTEMKPTESPPAGSTVRFMAFDPVNNVAVNVANSGSSKQTWVYRFKKK